MTYTAVAAALSVAGYLLVGISGASAAETVDCPLVPVTATNTMPTISGPVLAAQGPTKLGLPGPSTPLDAKLKTAYGNSVKFLVSTWWQTCYGQQTGPVRLGGTDERQVRPAAAAAFSIATSLQTGAYRSEQTGVWSADAKRIAKNLALGVAIHHRSNDSAGWGWGRQTTSWADYAGTAGWLLWTDLTPNERQAVAKMVASEADYQLEKPAATRVPYYADRSGRVLTPGDTKAEENAWNASVLRLAAMMMPTDPRVAKWNRGNVELLMSALARPADLGNPAVINGQPVSSWLQGTDVFTTALW